MSQYFTCFDDHIKIHVRLTPNAHKDEVGPVETGADEKSYLKAKVRAVPEKGKANKALEKLLAKYFGIAKSSVEVVSGSTSRIKTVAIRGDVKKLEKRL